MNDAINRVLEERERLDRGMPAAVVLSIFAHLALAGAGFAAVLIKPTEPVLKLGPTGFFAPLPPGGRGTPEAAPAAPAPPPPPVTTPPQPEAPKPEPPPKVLKPPKPEPRRGLPDVDAPRVRSKPEPAPARPTTTGTTAGTDTRTPGLEFGTAGPGAPGGTDLSGDFYLASVQRKIWMIWTQQLKPEFNQPIGVSFTILADGQVTDVRVVQPSGVALLDMAAQRAVFSAAPFGPLPKDYGTNRYTIQALFRPTR